MYRTCLLQHVSAYNYKSHRTQIEVAAELMGPEKKRISTSWNDLPEQVARHVADLAMAAALRSEEGLAAAVRLGGVSRLFHDALMGQRLQLALVQKACTAHGLEKVNVEDGRLLGPSSEAVMLYTEEPLRRLAAMPSTLASTVVAMFLLEMWGPYGYESGSKDFQNIKCVVSREQLMSLGKAVQVDIRLTLG